MQAACGPAESNGGNQLVDLSPYLPGTLGEVGTLFISNVRVMWCSCLRQCFNMSLPFSQEEHTTELFQRGWMSDEAAHRGAQGGPLLRKNSDHQLSVYKAVPISARRESTRLKVWDCLSAGVKQKQWCLRVELQSRTQGVCMCVCVSQLVIGLEKAVAPYVRPDKWLRFQETL
eukprot:1152949-Pelagomonas_calceolata.AAC.3